MATIRKRTSSKTGKVSWQIDYFDPTGKRVRQSFKKKKDAEAELGKRVSLIAENRYLDVKKDYTTNPLLGSCPVWLRHIVIFCIHTGARKKEVLNLKWHQIKSGHVYFEETKTDHPRQVPIDLDLQELLDSFKPTTRTNVYDLQGKILSHGSSNYVFQDNGMPIHKDRVQSAFQMACKRSNIPYGIKTPGGVTFHTLRHTFGSQLAIKGIPIKTIQELMGHKDITMTMRYAHLTEETKIEAFQVLNGLTSNNVSQTVTNGDFDRIENTLIN